MNPLPVKVTNMYKLLAEELLGDGWWDNHKDIIFYEFHRDSEKLVEKYNQVLIHNSNFIHRFHNKMFNTCNFISKSHKSHRT